MSRRSRKQAELEEAENEAAREAAEGAPRALPIVAVVGRPNVGKSTLFNRLVGGHNAIVEDEPGVTRDRRYGDADWNGRSFRVVDTGGLDLTAAREPGIAQSIVKQAMRAVDEAALILFLLDAQEGLTPKDIESAEALRRTGKKILWVANKVDGARHEANAAELYALGADEVIGISATHGRNMSDLLDAILARIDAPRTRVDTEEKAPIRVAMVGKPNAGKSSLVNRLFGDERVIVDATPGTTRDPVDTPLTYGGTDFILIDTAGIRRRASVEAPMEKVAVAMAEKAVNRCDVTVLVIDGNIGVTEQEAKIAGMCDEAGRALVIAFNKRDLVAASTDKTNREDLKRKLQFVPWAKVVQCSAKTGQGVPELMRTVERVFGHYSRRVTTGELNRWFEGLVERHPPSLYRGHPVKLYYITQVSARPPTFVLSVNSPDGIHFSYRRYLANQLREQFGFEGTPVRIITRKRNSK